MKLYGMVIVFFCLFGALKLVMGMKTWWHAILGGAVASILWMAFGGSGGMTGISVEALPSQLAIVAAVSIVRIMSVERWRHLPGHRPG
jgi:hypothetical protein